MLLNSGQSKHQVKDSMVWVCFLFRLSLEVVFSMTRLLEEMCFIPQHMIVVGGGWVGIMVSCWTSQCLSVGISFPDNCE